MAYAGYAEREAKTTAALVNLRIIAETTFRSLRFHWMNNISYNTVTQNSRINFDR